MKATCFNLSISQLKLDEVHLNIIFNGEHELIGELEVDSAGLLVISHALHLLVGDWGRVLKWILLVPGTLGVGLESLVHGPLEVGGTSRLVWSHHHVHDIVLAGLDGGLD
jgi:hypothetical protein